MTELNIFKEYCLITQQENKYGVVHKNTDGSLYVETFSGKTIIDIAYQKRDDKIYHGLIGKIVKLRYATCGHTVKCQIGKPQKKCIENCTYSENQCAVVFLEKVNITEYNYNLSYNQLIIMSRNIT